MFDEDRMYLELRAKENKDLEEYISKLEIRCCSLSEENARLKNIIKHLQKEIKDGKREN